MAGGDKVDSSRQESNEDDSTVRDQSAASDRLRQASQPSGNLSNSSNERRPTAKIVEPKEERYLRNQNEATNRSASTAALQQFERRPTARIGSEQGSAALAKFPRVTFTSQRNGQRATEQTNRTTPDSQSRNNNANRSINPRSYDHQRPEGNGVLHYNLDANGNFKNYLLSSTDRNGNTINKYKGANSADTYTVRIAREGNATIYDYYSYDGKTDRGQRIRYDSGAIVARSSDGSRYEKVPAKDRSGRVQERYYDKYGIEKKSITSDRNGNILAELGPEGEIIGTPGKDVSESFIRDTVNAYHNLPANLRRQLRQSGWTFQIAPYANHPDMKSVAYFDRLQKEETKPGWLGDVNLTSGFTDSMSKTLTVFEHSKQPHDDRQPDSDAWTKNDGANTIPHEVGHAVDLLWGENGKRFSESTKFVNALRNDFKRMSDTDRRDNAYYVNLDEAFAEVFSRATGARAPDWWAQTIDRMYPQRRQDELRVLGVRALIDARLQLRT